VLARGGGAARALPDNRPYGAGRRGGEPAAAAALALVAEGSTDAFADVAGDRHRIFDLAPAMILVPAAGGAVIDALGRPIEIDKDLTRRWSGVVAASPALAEELAAVIRGS
jgi:fructose-1,6-bisphosphatase/inositol monophosphatase family enzyme